MTSENILIGDSIEKVEDNKVSISDTTPAKVQNPSDEQDSSNPIKLDTHQINFDHAECLPLLSDRHDLHFNHFPGTKNGNIYIYF